MIGVSGQTLPGLSGSFIIMLLGNYVLLLVDSVNALYLSFIDVLNWDFSFLEDAARVRLLKVLAAFSLGSVVGLISLSHLLGYLLKHFKNATYALIIGFITGSLGVVWPWKEAVYSSGDPMGSSGEPVVETYRRYFPALDSWETWTAVFFIFFGIMIVISLEKYEKQISRSGT